MSAANIRVLVACEYSATVRDAFRARGFDAWSCDLLPTEGDPRWHIQGDAIEATRSQHWDLMVCHPPCTHLAVSGARWFKDKQAEQREALGFVADLFSAPIKHIALENPVSIISSRFRKPDQTIQPWQFGHGETKATCLWLNNLPKLKPTNIVEGREQRIHRMPPGPDRWKERSRTFPGVAEAMAMQWGDYLLNQPAASANTPGHYRHRAAQTAGANVLHRPPAPALYSTARNVPTEHAQRGPGQSCASGAVRGLGSSPCGGVAHSFHEEITTP